MDCLRDVNSQALPLNEAHSLLSAKIQKGDPFFLGRPGGTESEGLHFFLRHRLSSLHKSPKRYSRWFSKYVQIGPGVTHFSDDDLDYFCLTYLTAALESDVLAYGRFAPGALGLVRNMAKAGVPVVDFFHMEPLVALSTGVTPWSMALQGKKVLVVHPFEESIRSQYSKRSSITGVSDVLPDFSLDVVKPPVTFAGQKSSRPWGEDFADLVAEVQSRRFDIAIIGAGSYGLPLARTIRMSGKQAIHLGGSTQLLFGIRGKRWESEDTISRHFDDTWVRPIASERPEGSSLVEGGIYW
jgi:hypothetical protein